MTDKSANYRKSLKIEPTEAGERLDKVLALRLRDLSRSQLAKWIKDGAITVDGATTKPNFKLAGTEHVEIDGEFQATQDWQTAAEVDVNVVFQDDDLLVIDKPAGLVVHPGAATTEPTLANGLLAIKPQLSKLPRVGIVHRLDKDTSGLLVVATSELARVRLIEDLSERKVARSYVAVVEGLLRESREVNLPLGRSPRDRTRQTVRQDGREAITFFEPVTAFRAHSVILAKLQTGRTHQIRVHAARIGLPVVGDVKYGAKRRLPSSASPTLNDFLRSFPRQALHAKQLAFNHPRTGKAMRFVSELPEDMHKLTQLLNLDLVEHS